jgi:predicted HicB family RNase H-like nuclease
MDITPELPLTEAVHLKISAPLYRALKRLAEKQDCSVNSMAKKLLEAGVAEAWGETGIAHG